MNAIQEAHDFSESRVRDLRAALSTIVPAGELVVTCGSYARKEACPSSDLDYYSILTDKAAQSDCPWAQQVQEVISTQIGKMPSAEGAFAQNIARSDIMKNFGGPDDSNATITRRMLYLLEATYLNNENLFKEIRKDIITKYVANTPRDHQIAFYLLNDLVRYWRTIAVDYANKTSSSSSKKPWAIRNIKLVYSRKLIYASGLFSIALTADRKCDKKIDLLDYLFSLTPLERIKYVCGEPHSKRLFELYSMFLENISKDNTREALDLLKNREDGDKSDIYRQLKNEGHYFSRELMGLLQSTFHSSHPIHMAVIF